MRGNHRVRRKPGAGARRVLLAAALLFFLPGFVEAEISFVAAESNSNASVGSVEINVPAGTEAGDVLLAFIFSSASGAGAAP